MFALLMWEAVMEVNCATLAYCWLYVIRFESVGGWFRLGLRSEEKEGKRKTGSLNGECVCQQVVLPSYS